MSRVFVPMFALIILSACRGSEPPEVSTNLLDRARSAATCDDLVKLYEDHEEEALELARRLKAGEIEGDTVSSLQCGATMDKDSCGCPLSAAECTGYFFACFGGDSDACCWFDACYDRKNVSTCDKYCNECSTWGPSPVGGSGVGDEE